MKSPQQAIERALAAAQPNPPLTIDEWLETREGIHLPARGNAFPGPLDLNRTPYLKLPLRLFTNPRVERLGLCFGRQVGKTVFIFIILGYIVDYDPGPALLYYPTENMGKAISKDRIKPTVEATPVLRKHLTGRKEDFQLLSYFFDHCTVRFGHAGSEIGGRSHPIRYLLKDETSAMTASASSNADSTTTSFWNARIVEASTPREKSDNMWRFLGLQSVEGKKGEDLWNIDAWEPVSGTTVLLHYVPCPHCQQYIIFMWRQIKWPTDIAIRDIEGQAWYECQECGGKITDADKPDMLERGKWLCHPKQRGRPWGKWIGLHLPKMYGPWLRCGFGAIAREGVRARNSRDPEVIARFVNDALALPYSVEQEAIELVDEMAIVRNVLAYHRNTIPEGCKVLTIGIDAGKASRSRVHWVVQGFGAESFSWRIAWGQFDDLFQMEHYILTAVFQHPTAGSMLILCGAADSRWNKPEVIAFCKKFRNRIFPIQGERYIRPDPGQIGSWPHKAYQPERDIRGKPLPDSMIGYRINTVYWKQWLYHRLNCAHDQPETFFLPIERDEAYERHLRSEEEYITRKRGSGEVARAWRLREGYEQNHYLDSTVYGLAIANVFQLMAQQPDSPVLTGIKQSQEAPAPSSREGDRDPKNPMGFGRMNL